ncbi:MAG: hypothetical protein WCL47_09350 [Holophagaceae bacterium]
MLHPVCRSWSLAFLLLGGSGLQAQAPLVSDRSERLQATWRAEAIQRQEPSKPQDASDLSVALLSISRDSATPWMPLIHGMGLGTVTLGQGMALGGAWVRDGWTVSAETTFLKDTEGSLTRGRLLAFSVVKQTAGGWRWGLEKAPFQWGYGLFGGHLIGDSHDPVPRLLLESPSADLSLFGVPLGAWKFETFLGQLEWDRQVPTWTSTPQAMQAPSLAGADLRRPNLSGLRLRAAFGADLDMNFGVVSRWGGVDASGQNIMRGLPAWNYPLGFLGGETLLVAETTGNSQNPDPNQRFQPTSSFHNISNAVADVELRLRLPVAARWFGAEGLAVYLSRGASNVNWQWKDFLRNPLAAWEHDLRIVGQKLGHLQLGGSHPDSLWGWAYAQGTPGLVHINDTVGAQWVFSDWDLGLELADLHNQPYPASTYRVYSNGRFISGHSRYGDSLGEPLGGEVYHTGLNLGLRLPHGGRLRIQCLDAIRFFRDSPLTVTPFVPGVDDHFFHLQVEAQWTFSSGRIGGSIATERHQADRFIPGNRASNWILSLSYAVPIYSWR